VSTFVIGDVQACFAELQLLLEQVEFDSRKDKLWFVGDLVNKGSESLATLRFIKALGDAAQVVLGNHDLHLLASACGQRHLKSTDTFHDVLAAKDKDELLVWLRQQPLLHYDKQRNVLMTHAGLYPGWNLPQAVSLAKEVEYVLQHDGYEKFFEKMYGNEPSCWRDDLQGAERLRFIVNALTRMRFCDEQLNLDMKETCPVGQQSTGLVPWFELTKPANDLTIVFGHWAALQGVTNKQNILATDTGCYWGGSLTALRLEDKKRFTQKRLKDE
jgi:bis(5'-nucleosyl)-tetraphosphatase (symmetrical)